MSEEHPQRILGGGQLSDDILMREPYYHNTQKRDEKYNDLGYTIEQTQGLPMDGYGEDRFGTKYQQYLDYDPGAKELMYIAGGLRKDFRRIPGTQTLAGANAWISKNKKKNWRAFEEDITGPELHPDGIKEVFITDSKGKVKVVNGYTLKKSDYPWRKTYYETYTTPERQRETPFAEYKRQNMMPSLTAAQDGKYYYVQKMPPGMRPNVTGRTVYRKQIFAPTYKLFQEYIKPLQWAPMDKARLSSDIFKVCYESIIVKTAIARKLGGGERYQQIQNLDEKQYKKLLNKDSLKQAVIDELNSYLEDEESGLIMLLLKTAWMIIHALRELADIVVDGEKTVYGVKVSDLMSFGNVNEIEEGMTEEMASPVLKAYNKHNKEINEAIMKGYAAKFEESDAKRTARKQLHANFEKTRFAKGNARARRDAMFGDYQGLGRSSIYQNYYSPTE